MIYFYKTLSPHKIENLQKYLEYFFAKLFTDSFPTYTHADFIHANFQPVIDANTVQVDDKLKAIHKAYMKLKAPKRTIVKNAFKNNSNTEGICAGTVKPYKYIDLPNGIRSPLKSFYDELWASILAYARVVDKCGSLKEHFNQFRKKNRNSVCPFCGVDGLLNEYDDLKNAYDHYIPQKKYPFCSVLFKNLSPICDTCNRSGNKGSKDIPFKPKTKVQRPLYFPYATVANHKIKLSITSTSTDLKKLSNWTLNIDCVPATNTNKKEAWNEIFNIEKRYKAIIAKGSSHWANQIVKELHMQSKQTGFNLNNYITNKIFSYSDLENQKEAIVQKCFHEFYLNHPGFKKSIKGVI